jgi:hypothetical protein
MVEWVPEGLIYIIYFVVVSVVVVSLYVTSGIQDMWWTGVWGGHDTDVTRMGMCTVGVR